MKEILIKQIETYSNGIIAFIVLQGLVYSFYFGSNEIFNCQVRTSTLLAEILIGLFVVVTTLSIVALKYIGNIVAELIQEYEKIVNTIMRGKIVLVSIFGLLPAFLTYFYGIPDAIPTSCQNILS